MKQSDTDIKAIFFDLWNSLITGPTEESVAAWYRKITGSDKILYNREACMKIQEETPEKFIERFLTIVNDSYSLRFLLSIRDNNSPIGSSLIAEFKERVIKDCSSLRWLPGSIEVLKTLRERFIVVAVSNLWGYQRPYLRQNLKADNYFDHTYFSSDYGLAKVDLVKKAISDLGLKPEEILMVGDRYDNDIIPAIELGMRALKINNSTSVDPRNFLNEINRAIGPLHGKFIMQTKEVMPKKCLFIISPYYKMFDSHNNRINLGISTLAEIAESAGITSKIYHGDSLESEQYPSRYQILLNSINFYERLERHPVFQEVRDYIEHYKPDVIVITSGDMLNSFTDTGCWQVSLRVAREARLAVPDAYIISYGLEWGEPFGDFDAIVAGEAETEFLNIVKIRPRGILRPSIVPEAKLNDFPLFKKDRFVQDISPKGFDITYWRRGCIGKCQFCRVAETSGGFERFRPLEKFFEEIDYRYKNLGLRNFYFVDPNFTSNREKVKHFCKEMKNHFPDISWRIESRFDTLSEEIFPYLKDSGCTYLKLGLENALGEDHQTAGKKVSLQRAKEKIELIHEYGLKCIIYLMLGGYWYTNYDYEYMYENAEQLNADGYTISIMTPYVGTGVGIDREEWNKWGFTGSHLDIRLIDYWRIPVDIIEKFYALELRKGREDRGIREFKSAVSQ